MNQDPRGNYAEVNGLELYYEIHGTGKPLVLLHGGLGASEMFGEVLPPLAEVRQVIAVHLHGHGHTPDTGRPLRFELLADDIAALIGHLDFEEADLMGYSQGGGVALQTAIRHPEVVGKLVVVSAPVRRDGWYPEVLTTFEQMVSDAPQLAEGVGHSPLNELYPGKDWERAFAKMGEMGSQDYEWSDEVAAITSPTMIIFADADAIRADHIVEFYKLLGGGARDAGVDGSLRPAARMAILAGATHYDILSHPALASTVMPFLEAPVSELHGGGDA